MSMVLKVTDWSHHFENNRTRELKKMEWVPVPTKQDGDGYTELVGHKNGAAHLGAWLAIIQVAAKCEVRGTLMRAGATPHDSQSLARISRLPKAVFDEAIPRLIAIGWLETEVVGNQAVETIPQEGAADPDKAPQEGAVSRAPATRNGMEGNGTEGKGKTHGSPEPQAAAVPAILVFPTVGNAKAWELHQEHVDQLREAFPKLDILGECRKARKWCIDNEANRKTPKGMAKFLFSWMNRTQNSSRSGTPTNDPRGVGAAIQEYLKDGN